MKYLITLLLVISTICANAQKSESFFIGSWKVVDALLSKGSSDEDIKVMEVLKPGFLKTTFVFQADHKGVCKMPLPTNAPGLKPSENIYWNYNPDSQQLTIRELKTRKLIVADYIVSVKNDDVYFASTDGLMILKVKRVN